MKVHFINIISKNPNYIQIQLENFRKFIPNQFEYYVLNNARFDANDHRLIAEMAKELGVHHIPVEMPEEINRLSNGCGAINDTTPNATYALNYFCNKISSQLHGLIVLIHSDMFFMGPTNIETLLAGKDALFVPRFEQDLMYMWDGFCVFNSQTFYTDKLNWCYGPIDGKNTDCGGYTHFYLREFSPRSRFFEAWNIVDVVAENSLLKFDTHLNGNVRYYFDYDLQAKRSLNFKDQNGSIDKKITRRFPYEIPRENYHEYYAQKFVGIYEHFKKIGVQLPNPYWIDVLMPAESNEFVILHYKSGTNYMSFQNQNYNQVKLAALRGII